MKTPAYDCFKQQPRSSHSLAPRMAVRFSEIWLLIGVVFVVHLPVTRCQLCPQDSTFHDRTGSCIGLIRKYFTYGEAFYYCRDNFRGNTTKKDGHLVFIFDQATDEFVKGLLDGHDVDRAYIGLHDRAINGYYTWGDPSPIKATYTAWADNPHKPDVYTYKNAVVTTKDGWLEYDGNSQAYFVCQVSVDFPTPWIVCPLAEVGKQSPSITCTTYAHTSLSVTGVRFMKTSALVASCNANGCSSSQKYGQVFDVSKTSETRYSASWNLRLRDVRISDVTDWTCSVEFSNTGYWVASQPCRLSVYKKPTDIQCSQQFIQELVRTTCTAAQVYPQVGCQWTVNHGTRSIKVYDSTVSNDVTTNDGYYKATCSASFYVSNAGTYDATVAMFPKVLNFPIEAVTKTVISLSVERPQQPPQLYHDGRVLQSLWVELVENQTLSLTCEVTGGDPEVYRTIITCDNISQPFESDSNSVTMEVPVTRVLNGRRCNCSALHAASYTQTSSVGIRVAFPATVTWFWIAKTHSSTSINTGDDITFSCKAAGNPTPQLIIQLQNGLFVTNSSTGYVTYPKTATCSDTGKYVCLASNTVQGQPHHDSRVVHLQVRCAPEHCRGEPSVSLPVAVGDQPAIIKMCVRAFPAPTSFTLYKGNTTRNMLKADKFQGYFNFTNEDFGLGKITVIISPLTQGDLGDYMLSPGYRTSANMKLHSYLMFSLFPQGPPMCPTNFTLVKAGPDSVTLTWTPGFNGGLNQTFKVLHVDSPNATTTAAFTMLGTVEGQEDSSVYAVTGLSEGTEYTFGLEVRNEIGTGNCSHLQVTVSTSDNPSAFSGGVVTAVVAPVIVVLVLIILVVAVVVVARRRRAHPRKKSVYMSHTEPTGAGDTTRAGSSGAGETSQRVFNESSEDDNNVYANTQTPRVNAEYKNVKAVKKTSEEEGDNTYAEVNKQDKKGKKTNARRESPDKKKASDHGQESLYSRFTRNINFKAHKKNNTEQVYGDLADVYQNASNVVPADTSAASDPDNVYANVKASSPNKHEDTQEKKKNNYRTVNDEGLVYMSVEINKKTTNPEIIPAKKPVGTVSPITKNAAPEVEYIAIKCSAGVKQQ